MIGDCGSSGEPVLTDSDADAVVPDRALPFGQNERFILVLTRKRTLLKGPEKKPGTIAQLDRALPSED
jgi:hypothetical protein